MKIQFVKSDSKFRTLTVHEVDELINSTILKPLSDPKKSIEKRTFNNWELPLESKPYIRCKKYDPL